MASKPFRADIVGPKLGQIWVILMVQLVQMGQLVLHYPRNRPVLRGLGCSTRRRSEVQVLYGPPSPKGYARFEKFTPKVGQICPTSSDLLLNKQKVRASVLRRSSIRKKQFERLLGVLGTLTSLVTESVEQSRVLKGNDLCMVDLEHSSLGLGTPLVGSEKVL